MPTLNISPDFTMDDIRAIRDYNYEMTKDMTREERRAYYDRKCAKSMEWYNSVSKKPNPATPIATLK